MGQISFADAEYAGKRKKTRREVFLEEMELVVPWRALLKLIEPFYTVAGRGRRPYRSRQQARADVFDYIERFYNPTRRHSTMGYVSPIDFEKAQEA